MNVETIISEDFRFYTMNYALAQRKEVSDLDINVVYEQWEHYQKMKLEKQSKIMYSGSDAKIYNKFIQK